MPLSFRLATPADHARLEAFVIDSFEPITWMKHLDTQFEPLNGVNWRDRWRTRLRRVFAGQLILVGEADGQIVAMASGTYDDEAALGFIDLLAVDQQAQGQGYGRAMLRGMMDHFKSLGGRYVNLECLTDNDPGNALYRAEGFTEVARSVRWFKPIE